MSRPLGRAATTAGERVRMKLLSTAAAAALARRPASPWNLLAPVRCFRSQPTPPRLLKKDRIFHNTSRQPHRAHFHSAASLHTQSPPASMSDSEPSEEIPGPASDSDADFAPVLNKKLGRAKPPAAATDIYQRKSQLEHILLRPDTYIGSVESVPMPMWVVGADEKMVHKTIEFVPGLYKIFDEILSNAADNKIRDPSMNTIKVTIDKESTRITVENNGRGIPVVIHETEQMYIPELIFGHLLTSSNYDDDEKKITGGRNGFGAKLCNIFSKEFIVETSDSESGKKFKQSFSANMSKRTQPKITNAAKNDFTRISFKPDLAKFGMTELDDDFISLLRKRVYDIAGVVEDVKVFFNDERIKIKNFKEYAKLYIGEEEEGASGKAVLVHEKKDERWEVAFAVSDGQFQQVSFVNSICTTKGGTHVAMIVDQIVAAVGEAVKKKCKNAGGVTVKPHQIKSYISIFVKSYIDNPTFDSQTKDTMTLRPAKFGSKCVLSDTFLNRVMKSGIVDNLLELASRKQTAQLKKTDGSKRNRIKGIPKLDDANNAGTRLASECTLILTEGDSAKALAISGLGVVGRDNFGVFPLRGKLLNVREASHKQISENAEINAIKQILGLKHGQTYANAGGLRYGHVMIMTDQDHDGSHIKGLIINLFDHFWPGLLKTPGFLLQFITPIVKVTKGSREISFYTTPEYEEWRENNAEGKGWNIKYYKGLGTSTAADAKKYFQRMDHHLKPFVAAEDDDRECIDLAFSKKRADARKDWISSHVSGTHMDHLAEEIPISDFVNDELILFSIADNARSIPCLVDGMKPGQRKILFSCFKRNLTKGEIKVAQLAGYVSEHSAYHHGEASLQSTIVNLAQDYVGSNNMNLLEPRGQFGTRLQGGKDSAHARYIFTRLSSVARLIYHPSDDKLLKYLNEESLNIEPEWYIPILPMVLVNGADGIGTGWSTTIPNHNPRDIVANLIRKLNAEPYVRMHPWYRGFKGKVELVDNKYQISGVVTKTSDTTLDITELPIGSWTQTYKEFLEGLRDGTTKNPEPFIEDFKEYHTDTSVHFSVQLSAINMAKAEAEGLDKKFKMTTSASLSNMVLFDRDARLRRYASIEEILDEFYEVRLEFYDKRKAYLISKLKKEHLRLANQVRFVTEIITGDLVVQNRRKPELVRTLRSAGYTELRDGDDVAAPAADDVADTDADAEEDNDSKGFDYLLSMPIWNLTAEKVEKLTRARDEKSEELSQLQQKSPTDLWRADLDAFLVEWDVRTTSMRGRDPPKTRNRALSH
ncbi:DNA topoisomerase [Blyttiomyces helicus]|uniref:DNA topoisomerase 2 n=1 Tax=Blyttiomyces helicus TaxID=388810 RepID=A0A4P9WLW3_9FUNG|nr:DNA topoisomerase [Blyttiomyces helicus]|eukprot:RKO93185.1 DNA topoisomerase [Blyttiomyces helicus]